MNLNEMLAYSKYEGIKNGYLNKNYLERADLMEKATNDKIDQYGFVQDVCSAPHFNKPGISPEGQAFFLLMKTAVNKPN